MRNRIEAFTNLPLATTDSMTLKRKLAGIGAMSGSTTHAPQVA